LHLVQYKIDYWEKRKNATRQQDFKAIKEVLETAMKSSCTDTVEVSYLFNYSFKIMLQ